MSIKKHRRIFRLFFAVLVIVLVYFLFFYSKVNVGDKIPASVGKITGMPKLVHFWAEWCQICVDEELSINIMAGKFQNQIEIVMMKDGADDQIFDLFGVRTVPTSFLVDKNGIIVKKYLGAVDWQDSKVEELIEKIVKGE